MRSRPRRSDNGCDLSWKRSWLGQAARLLGLHQLSLKALEHRPPRFARLSRLTWYCLWLGSHGWGVGQMRSRYQGSNASGWPSRVALEVKSLLDGMNLEIPYPEAYPKAARGSVRGIQRALPTGNLRSHRV